MGSMTTVSSNKANHYKEGSLQIKLICAESCCLGINRIKDKKQRKMVLYKCLKSVKLLHDKNIAHLDLKPENFLIRK